MLGYEIKIIDERSFCGKSFIFGQSPIEDYSLDAKVFPFDFRNQLQLFFLRFWILLLLHFVGKNTIADTFPYLKGRIGSRIYQSINIITV